MTPNVTSPHRQNRHPCIFHEYSVRLQDVKLHYYESVFKTLMTLSVRDPPEVDVTDQSDGRHRCQ